MKKQLLLAALVGAAACWPVYQARAWWPQGHSLISWAAVRSLPSKGDTALPLFFRRGAALIAHCTQDPDVFKNNGTPHLSDREGPDHYIDWELLGNRPLPEKRSAFYALCAQEKLDPEDIGTLPYSVTESTERLAVAFAEHRKWPDNAQIRTKCLVYAGLLAHYAEDLQMPLHVTVHHDGRAKPDGTSPRTGIHARLDSVPEKLAALKLLSPQTLAQDQIIKPIEGELLPAVLREIADSRTHVDRAYELENQLPPNKDGAVWTPQPEIVAFGTERARAATNFTAQLYLFAWQRSRDIKLPVWLEREP